MSNKPDIDPQETQEWLDALEAVLENEGVERAHFLLERLIDKARRSGAYLPFSANTAYLNTIPVQRRSAFPATGPWSGASAPSCAGTPWPWWCRPTGCPPSSAATSPASPPAPPCSTSAYNHFFHGRTKDHGGDLVFIPGPLGARHLRPRLPGGADQRGAALQLPPGGGRQRPVLLSPSLAHAGLLAVPHRVHGPGAHHGHLPGPLSCATCRTGAAQHREAQGLGLHGRRRDGRAGGPGRHLPGGPRATGQPGVRGQLQPAAPGRPGARQRQDHPGAGGRVPRRRLDG